MLDWIVEYKENVNVIATSKRYMIPILTAALFTITTTQKLPKCPLSDEWIKKMWYMHICAYSYTKETNLATLITQMELESIIINEVRQTQKEKYHIIILICEILKKEKANKPEFIDSENRLLGGRGMTKWVKRVKRSKVAVIKFIYKIDKSFLDMWIYVCMCVCVCVYIIFMH